MIMTGMQEKTLRSSAGYAEVPTLPSGTIQAGGFPAARTGSPCQAEGGGASGGGDVGAGAGAG